MAERLITRKDKKVDVTALVGKFGEAVIAYGESEVTISKDGQVRLSVPVKEDALAAPAGVQASHLGSSALNPANQLISGGVVQLNQTDEYLSDLPNAAQAELLWFPKSGGEIFREGSRDLANWLTEIANIRSINENHEFHAHGEVVNGMQIFDHYENGHEGKYGKARADTIKQAWEQAKASGQAVMTGAALVTPELIRGYRVDGSSDNKSVNNNLRDDAGKLNDLIAQQNRANGLSEDTGKIITQQSFGSAHWQFSSREKQVHSPNVYSIHLTVGDGLWDHKRDGQSSSRAGVLRVLAP